MNKHHEVLDFYKIRELLEELALSDGAKKRALNLEPSINFNVIKERLIETTDGKLLMEKVGNPPIFSMKEIYSISSIIEKGDMLMPSHLREISSFVSSINRMKTYLKNGLHLDISLATWHLSFTDLNEIKEEIDACIVGEEVSSNASPALGNIRRKIEFTNNQIKLKLQSLLSTNKKYLSDNLVVNRNGRFTLPIKKEYKNKINGTVIDISRVGSTLYIEPNSVKKVQDELSLLILEEDNEVRRILYTLTALVEDNLRDMILNMDQMEKLDFIFAKAKLSLNLNANPSSISTEKEIKIIKGRNPFIDAKDVVPLDITLKNQGLIITGPNTGGKTVVLKTVGLFTIMSQCGLHIPAEVGSITPITDNIYCDIGDGQSIEDSLSTFSSHMKNIISILNSITSDSLVLLDELGSGTDPIEGMALAISILDEMKIINPIILCTTHYPEVKKFCDASDGFLSGCMAFDKENIQPEYKLIIGEHGESCALYIANKLGLGGNIISKAQNIIGNSSEIAVDIESLEFNQGTKNKKSAVVINKEKKIDKSDIFDIGDSITMPKGDIGIVYEKADKKGMVGVQVKGEKLKINYKRIKIKLKYYELYPEDYDFDIIFDTVENRKKRHIMSKRHDENIEIKYD